MLMQSHIQHVNFKIKRQEEQSLTWTLPRMANCMEDDCGEARDKLLPSLAGYHGTTRVFQWVYFIHAEINENHPQPKQKNFPRIVLWFQ